MCLLLHGHALYFLWIDFKKPICFVALEVIMFLCFRIVLSYWHINDQITHVVAWHDDNSFHHLIITCSQQFASISIERII